MYRNSLSSKIPPWLIHVIQHEYVSLMIIVPFYLVKKETITVLKDCAVGRCAYYIPSTHNSILLYISFYNLVMVLITCLTLVPKQRND